MTDREIADQLQYCSPHTILVVTWKGKLKVLHTPFRVKVLKKVGELSKNSIEIVHKIKMTRTGKTVFCIKGHDYLYSYFEISIRYVIN